MEPLVQFQTPFFTFQDLQFPILYKEILK
jgi:hypothetical protein